VKVLPLTLAGRPLTATCAPAGLTVPRIVTLCTPTVAPLVGALMERLTWGTVGGELEAPQPAALSAAAHTASRASLLLARISKVTAGCRSLSMPLRSSPVATFVEPADTAILAAVHFGDLSAPEQRVLGCLIEKRWTTPDQYPLSVNALRLACNQSTNRDPVTGYDEDTVRAAAQRLSLYGLARLASGHTSRSIKYRHLAEEGLGLGREPLAVLCVLLLRGPQTPGELKARSERMAPLGSLADVERVLDELAERGYARRLPRRPGQKEDRFEQLLGGSGADDAEASPSTAAGGTRPAGDEVPSSDHSGGDGDELTPPPPAVPAPALVADSLEPRVTALEGKVERLRAEVERLRAELTPPRSGS
jgi:uncharacterized protein YceH (UPF0502 family)